MKNYEITFVWPNEDWSWIYVKAADFHEAMAIAIGRCPRDCRVHSIQFMTPEQTAANKASALARGARPMPGAR